MKRENLRGISIIAAEAVEPRGIAVPAVRAVVADASLLKRSLSGTFSSPGSVQIRAPITINDDDDDDDGSVTEEHNSDAGSYSKGLDSGSDDDDDGFESVSGDADDETELEGLVMDGLRAAHGVLGEESVGDNGDDDDDDDASDVEEGSVVFRSLAGDVEEEASVNLEEESENGAEFEEDGMKAKVVIPRAILSLDDDEVLVDEEAEDEGRMLQLGDMGMVDEPECSDSVLTDVVSAEEEAVEMKDSDRLEDGSVSFGYSENETRFGLDGSSRQPIEEDGGCSIHESDAMMKPGDVEDSAVELGEREMTVLSDGSGSVTGELVSAEEDVVQVNLSDDSSVSFETSLSVAPGGCSGFVVESEGNAVDADETLSKLVEQGVGEESISKESDDKFDDGSACEADEVMVQGEESIGLESRESEDEDTGFMIGEAKEGNENACSAVGKLEKPECEEELENGMSSESSQVTPTVDSVMARNVEVARGTDAVASGCDSSNQKADQETENEGTQESEDIDKKLSLPDEDEASSLRNSFEMANESVETEEQFSEQIDEVVNSQSDSELNQNSIGIEETSLLSVKDVERAMPENSCVTGLIHNGTCMELDEYEGTGETKEKLTESTFQNHSEDSSSDHSPQLISGRVKERVEKTKLLKEKLQIFIGGIDLCSEDSAVTEVESLVGVEHHTSLELDHMTNTKLPEQELPLTLDFSINVLVIGKTGVGKSATINSIFGETKSAVGAFTVTTKTADYVVGSVGGILVRILDTPGLMTAATEERYNQEVLRSVKKRMRRFPVDVILYIDRLDENPDIRLLRTITSSLGSSIWRNAIVVLTHAASSNLPDSSSSYIAQRSCLMHQSIREAVPELRKMPGIVLAENNVSSLSESTTCPDWRLNLLILCCSIKIRCKRSESTLTRFCSLWNVLVNQGGHVSQSLDDLEEKKRRLMESYPEILWDEQCQDQEPEDEEKRYEEEEEKGRRRRRRGSLGFQATKRLGIYLDTCDLHTGFSMGSRRKVKQEEGKMSGSLCVLGAVHVLMSVIITCVYARKDI